MRIVIDMQGAQTESRFRGIGRYTMSFAQAIARHRGEHEVLLALSGLFPDTIEPIRTAFEGLLPQKNIRVWHAPGPVREGGTGNTWRREVAELIREAFLASLKPDVIHISSLFEGYIDDAVTSIGRFDKSTLVSVSLYDLIPLLNPDNYLKPNPSYEQYYLRKVNHLRKAGLLFAISEYARQEGVEHLPLRPEQVVNVSTAIEDPCALLGMSVSDAAALKSKFGIARPFVLYTGGADERKNLPRLIQAYARLSPALRQAHQLVLAGKVSDGELAFLRQAATQAGLIPEDIRFTSYVTDDELVALYNLCTLFVFPSWHEGFGLPALEAMACGAAVIAANTTSLPEVIGRQDALFDPFNVHAICTSMTKALEDQGFREELSAHGLRQAKKYSWDESARRAIAALEANRAQRSNVPSSPLSPLPRPRLAFVSPLPPERTGIADYSAELLPALAEYYDLELIVTQPGIEDPQVSKHGRIRSVQWLRKHADEIDRVIYQVGNSPFHQHMLALMQEIPGIVVLHDFFLSSMLAHHELHGSGQHTWVHALYASHGYRAVEARFKEPHTKTVITQYPANFAVLQHAQGVIVHSEYSRGLAEAMYGANSAAGWRVIPHLRAGASAGDRTRARTELDISPDDFIVCSFGFLDATKLNHRLLQAWLQSKLGRARNCKLVFVGQNEGGGYGASLVTIVRDQGLEQRVRITGFAEATTYGNYLAAADLAVQLRAGSRGETSGAILDCMNHAVPTIVNANGSMAELDADSVWMLPDDFRDQALVEALETLWHDAKRREELGRRAREVIQSRHAPDSCARQYVDAIETFHRHAATGVPHLLESIATNRCHTPSDAECRQLAQAISRSLPLMKPGTRLFLDITATYRTDLKTGIERVARALTLALIHSPPAGYRVEPVRLNRIDGQWHYLYARRYTLGLLGCPPEVLEDEIVEPESGDVVLGLDLSGSDLVAAEKSGLHAQYRRLGVKVFFLVYDLLPVRMPNMFPPGADVPYAEWLGAVARFDGAVGISKAVADDLLAFMARENLPHSRNFKVAWSHLGADVDNSAPSQGLPSNAAAIVEKLKSRPSFLMVGTVEPRKGYLQAIDAFSLLWQQGCDVNLVIVGHEGWRGLPDDARRTIPETVRRLRSHEEFGRRLFWLEGISDEYLEKVYEASTCLVAASEGEGFGLPLIEAAQHKLPIIARDIPVFREVAGNCAYYFRGSTPGAVVDAVQNWLSLYATATHPGSEHLPWLTWQESAQQLISALDFEVAPEPGPTPRNRQ